MRRRPSELRVASRRDAGDRHARQIENDFAYVVLEIPQADAGFAFELIGGVAEREPEGVVQDVHPGLSRISVSRQRCGGETGTEESHD